MLENYKHLSIDDLKQAKENINIQICLLQDLIQKMFYLLDDDSLSELSQTGILFRPILDNELILSLENASDADFLTINLTLGDACGDEGIAFEISENIYDFKE